MTHQEKIQPSICECGAHAYYNASLGTRKCIRCGAIWLPETKRWYQGA